MNGTKIGIVLPMPFDGHVHVRQDEVLKRVLPATARDFGRAIIMPNTNPPICTESDLRVYRNEIMEVAPPGFEPLMTIYLTQHTTPENILEAGRAGAVAAKYYPKHGTTNAGHGLEPESFILRGDWFAALTEAGMVLSIHAEHPAYPMTQRERKFLDLLVERELPLRFPKLRFVIEHISTAYGLAVVDRYENVGATVTAHHLILTTEDVIGNHDYLCMPVAKSERDRTALLEAVVQGQSPRIFFGSDSAPHPQSAKNRVIGAFGIYTAPVALPLLAQLFVSEKRASNLSAFVSTNGPNFYRLPEAKRVIEIVPEQQRVFDLTSDGVDAIAPFCAGQVLHWTVRHDR